MTLVSAKWEEAFSAGFRQTHHSAIYLMFVDFAWNELPKVVSKSNLTNVFARLKVGGKVEKVSCSCWNLHVPKAIYSRWLG